MSQNEPLGYAELEQQVQQAPLTWLPGLLFTLVTVCVQRNVYQAGGLIAAVARAQQTAEGKDGESRVREDAQSNVGG